MSAGSARMLPATAPDIVRVMAMIAARDDVSGVYLRGASSRAGAPALVVMALGREPDVTLRKHIARLHMRAGALPIEITSVGVCRADGPLDHTDPVCALDSTRLGTLGLVATTTGQVLGLTAGHAVLPFARARHLTRTYPFAGGPEDVWVEAKDEADTHQGLLLHGAFGGAIDYAVVSFATAIEEVDDYQQVAQTSPPLALRAAVVETGGSAVHYSVTRCHVVAGEIDGYSPTPIKIRVDDEYEHYLDVVVVRGLGDERFSQPGDSGSLVVDADQRAWGVLIGSAEREDLAFVLTLPPLIEALGDLAPACFALEKTP